MRPRAALLLAVSLLAPIALRAQEPGQAKPVEILEADAAPIGTRPGDLISRALFVSNRDSEESDLTLSVEAPPGWVVLGATQALELPLKGGDTVIVSFRVPSSARAGSYRVAVLVRGNASGAVLGERILTVGVQAVQSIRAEHLDAPAYVIAGEVYQSRFRVGNSGNTAVELELEVRPSPSFEVAVDAEKARLEPGEWRTLTVLVRTPSALSARVRSYLYLLARSAGTDGASARATSGVEVLPRITGATRRFDVLPITVTAVQGLEHGEVDRYAVLATVEAEGSLSPSGDDRFALLVSAPLDRDGSVFPQDPVFRLSYESAAVDLFAGTRFFALSSLTERSISGTGVEGSFRSGAFRLGAYHLLADSSDALARQTAAYASLAALGGSTLRLHILDSSGIPARGDRAFFLGGQAAWKHPQGPAVDVEYASADIGAGGDALRIALSGAHRSLGYQLGLLRASPGYAGPVGDREEYTASLAFPLVESARLSASLKRERTQLDREVPLEMNAVSTGFSWALDRRSTVAASWRHVSRAGSIEESGRLSFSRSLGSATLGLSAELGGEREGPGARPESIERYRATVSFSPGRAWELTTSLTVESTGIELDVDTTWRPDGDTRLRLAYSAAEKRDSFYDGRDSLRIEAGRRFAGGLTLSVVGSYSPDRSLKRPTDFSLQAELRLPLELPLRRRAAGRIVGTVTDAATGRGVPDVILRAGQRIAVTDLRGAFLFPDLPPGTHYVAVDTSRVREDRLVASRLPLAVEVAASQDTRLELRLVAPARLQGQVSFMRTGEDGVLHAANPFSGLLVEILRDGELRKTLTDREGRFSFPGLLPGRWRLHFATEALPPQTAFARNDLDIDLEPGDAPSIEGQVLQIRREMKLVDEGEIIEEQVPETEGPSPANGSEGR